jgi:hypothetical protein
MRRWFPLLFLVPAVMLAPTSGTAAGPYPLAVGPVGATAIDVNGLGVPASLVEARYRWLAGRKGMFRHSPLDEKALRDEAVRFAIEAELARQTLAAMGRAVTHVAVDEELDAERARQGGERARFLRMHGQDEASLRELRWALLNRELYDRVWSEGREFVTAADVERHYRENYGAYNIPERARVECMTLITTDPYDRPLNPDMARIAAELRRRVTEGKMSFEAAAADSPWPLVMVTVRNRLFPVDKLPYTGWEPHLRGLRDGEVSQVIRVTPGLYSILRPLGREPAVHRTLDEVKGEIRDALLPARRQAAVTAHFEEMARGAKVRYPDPKYDPAGSAAP